MSQIDHHAGDCVDHHHVSAALLARAAGVVRAGGIVVFPTESFYGLAADPRQADAMARLRALKGREADKPIALIAADAEIARQTIVISEALDRLCAACWPGPLTVVGTDCLDRLSPVTVGVRVSGHAVARELARQSGGLITATSANLAGGPPVVEIDALHPILREGVDLVIDGGALAGGAPSTIITTGSDGAVRLLRAGAIEVSVIEAIIGAKVCTA